MSRPLRTWLLGAAPLVLALGGCGGSGGTHAVPATTASAKPTTTTLKITVPHAAAPSASHRAPSYVSASTQSIVINIMQSGSSLSGFPLTANLTASSTGCTASVVSTVCDVQLNLPPGIFTGTFATYDQANGSGNQLSAAQSAPIDVVEGQPNTIPLVLGGVPTSVQLLAAGGGVVAAQQYVFTLPAGATGTVAAYGIDADGNTIIGAGAPAISASSDNVADVSVTQPTAASPNAVGVTSAGATAIAHVTFTVTPVAGSGGATVTRWVTVQPPSMSLLYIATVGVRVFDMTATEVTPSGTAFSGSWEATGIAYNPTNGLIYVGVQYPSDYIVAFNKNGVQQTLNNATTGLGTVLGLVYDPANGMLYAPDLSTGFDPSGNPTALGGNFAGGSYNSTYDPTHNVILVRGGQFNTNGVSVGSIGIAGNTVGVAYDPVNQFVYAATVYPTDVFVYDTNGNSQSVAGTFINGSAEAIGGIGTDPLTGNVFLATNYDNTYGFDQNGNALPAPWHTINNAGSPSGAAGIALIPP